MLDLRITGGSVIDGTGKPAETGDIGIKDGRIVEVGRVSTPAHRTIAADGLAVTPGFVDIHTHYDGQALWDDALDPSFSNGVTTAILGNCGVGFAPCSAADREVLVDLMDGVEEIPGSVLAEGLKWDWTSFPEYMDRLDEARHSFNIGALATHGPLRFHVLGKKVIDGIPAGESEITAMQGLLKGALAAGAFGMSSSRTALHVTRSGKMTPDYNVEFRELRALAETLGAHDSVFEFAPAGVTGDDVDSLRRDMAYYERLANETGARVHLLMQQIPEAPDFWQEQLVGLERVAKAGGRMNAQVHGRGIGLMMGLLNTNPFQTRETFIKVSQLPLDQRLAEFRKPEVRARILADADHIPDTFKILGEFIDRAYAFTSADDYEPDQSKRVREIARQEGRSAEEVAYDLMLRDGLLFTPILNYHGGDLEVARQIISSPHCLVAASDAGAHSLTICDGALPTFMLTHWTRDRTRGARLPVESVVHMLSAKPARAIGLSDRGVLAPGMAADLNLIDLAALKLGTPKIVSDLPSGAPRLLQLASGYRATVVNGTVTRENDADTGARPGALIRRRHAA